ncbi:MAG: Circadian clock protein kinase KaiC [Syntrophus sp. SKADARSKE-3]|nr:Circadian clock protein kinase KaiC [Syntrophus sp. SKADARSKE-3]
MSRRHKAFQALAKAPSFIPGFDEILYGGLPEGRTTLVEGGPGTGKSIVGLEFLYRGALVDESAIFVTFEERADAVRRNAATMGWDLEDLEKADKLVIIEARMDPETVISGDFNIKALLAIIEGQSKAIGAKRIVFDAMDILIRLFDNLSRERSEMYLLNEWLLDRKMTAILTVKASGGDNIFDRYEYLEFMADCVIRLIQRPGEWVSTRELQVIKYRGSDFGRNAYPFVIQPGGLSVIPISEFGLQHQPMGPHTSSGNKQMDSVLGGGYRRGSSILIAGSSGTGKTTIANTFVKAACDDRGEKVLFLGFEESEEAIVATMLSPGIDLRTALKKNLLKMMTAMPEAFGTEKHLVRTFDMIDAFKPDHVVVDAISSFGRMGSDRAAFEFAMRLSNRCKDRGITLIMTNQSSGESSDRTAISGIGISSIIDALLWLRFIEEGNELKRKLLVIKSRGSKHSSRYQDFRITDHGIEVSGECAGDAPKSSGEVG